MPNQAIVPKPGVNLQRTPLLLGTEGWSRCQLIRFKDGLLQKLGGSTKAHPMPFVGICRGISPVADFSGNGYTVIGTNQRLEVLQQGVIYDITPVAAIENSGTPFTTVMGSSIVTYATALTGMLPGDWLQVETATYIDGMFLQGFYQIITATPGVSLTFDSGTPGIAGVASGGVTITFHTTHFSADVKLTLGAYAWPDQSNVLVFVSTSVATLLIKGNYTVTTTGGPTYTITLASGSASSTTTGQENGGNVRVSLLLSTAVEPLSGPGSFGAGLFGAGLFGSGGPAPIGGWLRQWSIDHWGATSGTVLANPSGGAIYTWTPPWVYDVPAAVLGNSPAQNIGMFVAMPQQQVISFGCTDANTAAFDPMLIRWTDVGDDTIWVASATNQAGSFRLSIGNQIVGGSAASGQVMFWTDLDFWVAQYVGFPLVYGFNRVGKACGLWNLRCAALLSGMTYWFSQNGFFRYDGGSVVELPCTVWDHIFNSDDIPLTGAGIDQSLPGAAFMWTSVHFNEFFLFYPTPGSNGVANVYVKCNLQDPNNPIWDYGPVGSLARSAGADQSAVGNPVATDYNGFIQIHETSTELDGVAMDSWAQSGQMAIAEGAEYTLMKQFLPDFILSGSAVLVTLYFSDYLNTTDPTSIRTYGPYVVTATTPYFWPNARGRYVSMRVESIGFGVFWRLGKSIAVMQPDGKR